jgi:hypothetical protein
MPATTLVQTRIDPALKERAAAVLDSMGLTVSDAVRVLLTRIANEGALPFPLATDPGRAGRLVPGQGATSPAGSPSGSSARRRGVTFREGARRGASQGTR